MTTTYPHNSAALLPDVHDLITRIAQRRGWDSLDATSSAEQSQRHAVLPGLTQGVDLLVNCLRADANITILTDYDTDGLTGGLCLYAGLAELGARVNMVVPDYHGARNIVPEDINHALHIYPETNVIITCDVGINSNEGLRYARTLGITTIVTDHHIEDPHDLCVADVAINPNRVGSTYPEPHICGAQVAHILLTELDRALGGQHTHAISMLRVLAGIGALADVMPIVDSTRQTVTRAMALLRLAIPDVPTNPRGEFYRTRAHNVQPHTAPLYQLAAHHATDYRYLRVMNGLSVLLRELIALDKLKKPEDINTSFIGFTLGPMINATRRIGGDVHDTVRIFAPQVTEPTEERHMTRAESVAVLVANNIKRQQQALEDLATIYETEQPLAPYVWFSPAAPGMLGLLASTMSINNAVPTVVLNPETLSGSGRAPDGYNILDIVEPVAGLKGAGHPQACGVRVTDPATADDLYEALRTTHENAAVELIGETAADLALADVASWQEIDPRAESALRQTLDSPLMPSDEQFQLLVARLATLSPFGQGFDYPVIHVTVRTDEITTRRIGSNDQHLKITTPSGMNCMWWNVSEQFDDALLEETALLTMAVEIGINSFAGSTSAQMIVRSAKIQREGDIDQSTITEENTKTNDKHNTADNN